MRSLSVVALFMFCIPVVTGCSGGSQAAGVLPPGGSAADALASNAASAAALDLPSDFPPAAAAGTRQRFASAAWDGGRPSSPAVTLHGPGSVGAEAWLYSRSDRTSAVAVYFPLAKAPPQGWLSVGFGGPVTVPLLSTADDAGTWTDRKPGLGASTTIYLTPARVTLLALGGSGSAAPSPSPSKSPHPSPAPIASGTPPAHAHDVSSCAHFGSNPECAQLPAHPSVSPYSAAWAALDFQAGRNRIPSFNAKTGSDPYHDSRDGSDPPLDELKAGGSSIAQVISCSAAAWGPYVCSHNGISGKTLHVPATMEPAGNSDHHYSYSDDAAGGEYDFWLVKSRPGAAGSTLVVGAGGFCSWSGDGTACSGSNATNIAGSLGSITEADFARGESDPQHGTFGHAISFSALCADATYVYPANASDGANTNGSSACSGHTGARGRPPEGTRVYLDLSDAQVDALNLPAYAKAFWRTFDREHEGGFIADTNWSGAPGLSPAFQRDDFSAQAREAGVDPAPYAQVPIGTGTIDMAADIKFCTNGTC